jgi:transcriptional regulator with XRE-family HTH domain
MLDILESIYRKYEADKSSPNLDVLNRIAKTYNMKIADLLPYNCVYGENMDSSAAIGENTIKYLSDKIISLYENQIALLKEQMHELKKENAQLKNCLQ